MSAATREEITYVTIASNPPCARGDQAYMEYLNRDGYGPT